MSKATCSSPQNPTESLKGTFLSRHSSEMDFHFCQLSRWSVLSWLHHRKSVCSYFLISDREPGVHRPQATLGRMLWPCMGSPDLTPHLGGDDTEA